MDPKPNVSLNSSSKTSILLVFVVLVIILALPFILVKLFPNRHQLTGDKAIAIRPEINLEIPLISQLSPVYYAENRNNSLTIPYSTVQSPLKKSSIDVAKIVSTRLNAAVKISKPAANDVSHQHNESDNTWQKVNTYNKESLSSFFKRMKLSNKTLQLILHDNSHLTKLLRLNERVELQFLMKKNVLEKMIVPISITQYLSISHEGEHYRAKINNYKIDHRQRFLTAIVQGSLYTTAKKYQIPYKLIQQMTEIFTWDIDFARDLKNGDQFTIIYQASYVQDKLIGVGDIIAVSYLNHGRPFQAIRHTNRLGGFDYYSPLGTSLKKAFTRYPLHFSHISSTFSLSRYHPILHYRRAHKGVDLAAPIGTPIQATGDGYIDVIGRQNGYGNMIKINHNNIYNTVYGHMLKFQKGLSKGSFVRRGQIIGYVGQTGLAAGPHCHYEFHINKQPKNPATVDLPRGNPISGRELSRFRANSIALLSQLKIFEQSYLAHATKKSDRRRV